MNSTLTRLKWLAAALSVSLGAAAQAQQEVKIGVIYPLTGSAASSGAEMKNALELAADIINNGAKGIPDLPFSAGGGLPGLKGREDQIGLRRSPGQPADRRDRSRAADQPGEGGGDRRRLQQQRHGDGEPGRRALQDPVPERESSSASLTQRGFKWFFRTTAHDDLFVRNFFEFMKEFEAKRGTKVGPIATINENTLWGTETTKLEASLAPAGGFNLVKQITYPAQTTQLTSEVQTLKAASPKVVMQSSYLGDALLSMKTYKELGFTPDMILANDAGFSDTGFIKTLGKDADYIISRGSLGARPGQQEPAHQAGERPVPQPLQRRLHRQLGAHLYGADGHGRRHQPRRIDGSRGHPQSTG